MSRIKEKNTLPEILKITPCNSPINAEVSLPGSKSISNRALMVAALTPGLTRLSGILFSRDTWIMITALKKLGLQISINSSEKWVEVLGIKDSIPVLNTKLDVGNAGTAARFLTAFLILGKEGIYELDGDEAMRSRPMSGLINALSSMGVSFYFSQKTDHFPFTMKIPRVVAVEKIMVDASASSQILSALIMVLPKLSSRSSLQTTHPIRRPFVDMTLALMAQFGILIRNHSGIYLCDKVKSNFNCVGSYEIEPDISAASYFYALPMVVGGTLRIRNAASVQLQGDREFVKILSSLGLKVMEQKNDHLINFDPIKQLPILQKNKHEHIFNFNLFSDTFLTLAAIVPALGINVKIEGIEHTRFQETDRVSGMARELRRIGQKVEEGPSFLRIQSDFINSATIETYQDHRFAMSFAILGCSVLFENKPISIRDPFCCGKTFPEFFKVLDQALYGGNYEDN